MAIIFWASLGGVGAGLGIYFVVNPCFFPEEEEARPRIATPTPRWWARISPNTPLPHGLVTGLTKTEAEDLLDWLETTGHRNLQVDWSPEAGFTVEY